MIVGKKDCFYFKDEEDIKVFKMLDEKFLKEYDEFLDEDIGEVSTDLYYKLRDIGINISDCNDSHFEEEHTAYINIEDKWYCVNYYYDILAERTGYTDRKIYFVNDLSFSVSKCNDDIQIFDRYSIDLYANDENIKKIKEFLQNTIGNDNIINISLKEKEY